MNTKVKIFKDPRNVPSWAAYGNIKITSMCSCNIGKEYRLLVAYEEIREAEDE